MITDNGFRNVMINRSTDELLDILINHKDDYQKNAILDIETILEERNVQFSKKSIEEFNKAKSVNLSLSSKDEFAKIILRKCNIETYKSLSFMVFILIVGALLLFFYGKSLTSHAILAIIIFEILFIPSFTIKFGGQLRRGKFWLNLIRTKPKNIVWVNLKIQGYKESEGKLNNKISFELLTSDKKRSSLISRPASELEERFDEFYEMMDLIIKSEKGEKKIFMEGLKKYLPNVHFGYSKEINDLYKDDPAGFIIKLKEKGLYTPVSSFKTK